MDTTLLTALQVSKYFRNIPHYLCTCMTGMALKLSLQGNFTSTNTSQENIRLGMTERNGELCTKGLCMYI